MSRFKSYDSKEFSELLYDAVENGLVDGHFGDDYIAIRPIVKSIMEDLDMIYSTGKFVENCGVEVYFQ